jgi:hypothetical protein
VVCGVSKVNLAETGTICSSFDIEMMDLYSLTAPKTAKNEAEARADR